MAIVSSGTITFLSLVGEFGGTSPHGINEYYRGGSLVIDSTANANIPTSGTISLSNFYNAEATVPDILSWTQGSSTYFSGKTSSTSIGVAVQPIYNSTGGTFSQGAGNFGNYGTWLTRQISFGNVPVAIYSVNLGFVNGHFINGNTIVPYRNRSYTIVYTNTSGTVTTSSHSHGSTRNTGITGVVTHDYEIDLGFTLTSVQQGTTVTITY